MKARSAQEPEASFEIRDRERQGASNTLAMCVLRQPIDVGYVRELTSNLRYCDHACYQAGKMAFVPWSLAGFDNFALVGLQLVGDFQRALLDVYRN